MAEFDQMPPTAQEAHLAALPDDAARIAFIEEKFPGTPIGDGGMPAHITGAYVAARTAVRMAERTANIRGSTIAALRDLDDAEKGHPNLYSALSPSERADRRLDLLARAAEHGIAEADLTRVPTPAEIAAARVEERFAIPSSTDNTVAVLAEHHAQMEKQFTTDQLKAMAADLRAQNPADYDRAVQLATEALRSGDDPTATLSDAALAHPETLRFLAFIGRREQQRLAALGKIR